MNEQKFFIEQAEEIISPVNDSKYERILAIGDVHGAFEKLESLLEKVSVTASDLVIFLGDYFYSENSKNLETLLRLAELNQRENFIFLRGNVDENFMAIFSYEPDSISEIIFRYFFRSQPELLSSCKQNVPKILLNFLKDLPAYYSIAIGGKKYFFCHAGVNPDVALEEQDDEWFVDYYGDLYRDFYKSYAGEALIVVGHKSPKKILKKFPELFKDGTDNIDPTKPLKIPGKNILMLDTRAKEDDGWLSCVDVLSGQFWQSC